MKNELCLIIPYFGPFKTWAKFFFKSAALNSEYSWLLFHDSEIPFPVPNNMLTHKCSLQELNSLISEKLKIKTSLIHPYKLCDFKPAYGIIFEDYIKKFAYWGYCDLDVVFGNMPQFLSLPMSVDADIISPDTGFYPGHFMVFKNSTETNQIFTNAENYKDVFSSANIFLFDEFIAPKPITPTSASIATATKQKLIKHKYGMALKRVANKLIPTCKNLLGKKSKYMPENCKDFNSAIRHAVKANNLKIFASDMYASDVDFYCSGQNRWAVLWDKGKLSSPERELLYFHFQLSKNRKDFNILEKNESFLLQQE